MKRRKWRVKITVLLVLLFILAGGSVQAEEKEETGIKKGAIHINLEEGGKGTSRKGVVFAYTKVAEIVNGDFAGEEYMEGIELDDESSALELQKAAEKIAGRIKSPDGTVVTGENGAAHVEGLAEGVYLLTVPQKADYDRILPFLVTIPSWNEKSGQMEYEICVIPKHEPERKERPTAPQTNLNSHYRQKLLSAGICLFGAVMLFVFVRRKEEDEAGL